jgi:hypothetical protein
MRYVMRVGSLLFAFEDDRFIDLGLFAEGRLSIVTGQRKRVTVLAPSRKRERNRAYRARKKLRAAQLSTRSRSCREDY